MTYIIGDVTIERGYVCVDGVAVEVASNLARNEFGNSHDYTWEEVARMGVPIWANEEGEIWCEDPECYMK
jgi:hypothetical protein